MIPLKFGALDLTIKAQTWLLMSQKEFNTWIKSNNPWFLLSKILPSKECFANRIWEVWGLMLPIANFTLMLSIEEEDKLCLLLEDYIMPLSCSANHHFFNQSSVVILLLHLNAWVVFINLSIKEEDKSFNKSKLLVPP